MKRTRRSLLIGMLVLSLSGSPAWAQESGGGGDNVAIAINTKDGTTVFKLAFAIRRALGDVVDQGNAAVAFATCEACRTVAIAIQTVLVFSDPSVVTPENLAIALNEGCTACETMAFAYQFVLGTDGPVHFTPEGNRTLADIRKQLKDLRTTDLAADELELQLDAIVGQLQEVINTQLVPAGRDETEEGVEGAVEATPASPTPLESPSPSVTPTPSPTPDATVSATPTPTP